MPVQIFVSYSHKDEDLRVSFQTHLAPLRRIGWISEWHDRRILAGSDWRGVIDRNLRTAQIIILLVSADFLASDYCYEAEAKMALDRHRDGTAVVVPVILRPSDWGSTLIGELQVLPREGLPITKWSDRDEAYLDVVQGIRQVILDRFHGLVPALPQASAATRKPSEHQKGAELETRDVPPAKPRREIGSFSVRFELITPDRLRKVFFGLSKQTLETGDILWIIKFHLLERKEQSQEFDFIVRVDVEVKASLNGVAETTANKGLSREQMEYATTDSAENAKAIAAGDLEYSEATDAFNKVLSLGGSMKA